MRVKDWQIGGFHRDTAVELCRHGVNPLVSVFLASRGVRDTEDARAFLYDMPDAIYDPNLMKDMDKAVARIRKAVETGERIVIYGDYDVDGMTACALLAVYLRSKAANFEIYIPGRIDEGYGLNRQALDTIKARGTELVVTVDCGITALEEAEYARSIGLDLIVTDHHECKERLPAAEAVVDPKRQDCEYPNDSLAGVGVAFKLVCALESVIDSDEMFRRYGDLVALGTIADVMPVTGENRELIRRGLRVLNNSPRPGLRRLLRESCSERGRVNSASVGFVLAPRLNAAGRMGQTNTAVELLLTQSDAEAELLVAELDRLNSERKKIETEIHEEAEAMLRGTEPDGPIVLAQRDWYQGVTGIVAAKMAERYLLPTIIVSIGEDGVGRGSCRSFGPFGIYGALDFCRDLLESYGGHEMAAGVTIAEHNIDDFRRRIKEYYRDNIKSTQKPGLKLDFEVEKPELLSETNIDALMSLEPFGSGNPPPCLCIRDAKLVQKASVGGGKHTRLRIEKSGKQLDGIYFSMAPEDLGADEGDFVDIAFEPQINEFRGRRDVQLLVLDIQLTEI